MWKLQRDPLIVAGAERLFAEIGEGEARHAARRLRHGDAPPLVGECRRLAPLRAGQRLPQPVERRAGGRPERRHIDRRAGELAEPVVGRRIEMDDVGMMLEHRDEGQEQAAVQPVAIELVGRHVGGCDQHHSGGEQALEQARQDHRIGDVLDLEFVEADEPHLMGDHRGDRRDRIAVAVVRRMTWMRS